MLSATAIDISGNKHNLLDIKYCTINSEEDAPADDLTIVIPYEKWLPELDLISVYYGKSLVFNGIIDEEQYCFDHSGKYFKITARSMAAALLDNESKPVCYNNPSLSVIAQKHLEPHGIKCDIRDNRVFRGEINVGKGSTDWQAFHSFCINTFGTVPRINADGTASPKGIESRKELVFNNCGGINYTSINKYGKRYKLVSKVYAKLSPAGDYTTVMDNKDAVARNVKRVRYLDATAVKGSVTVGDKMIKNSLKSSCEIILVCPQALVDTLGAGATIEDDFIGEIDGLYVSGICYRFSPKGEYTTVTLKAMPHNL